MNGQAVVEIKATYRRREDSQLSCSMGLYSCFNRNKELLSVMEDKDQIVLCDPATLEKLFIY